MSDITAPPSDQPASDQLTSDPGARLRHHGDGGELFAIHVRNLSLSVITLGVYRFWAKTLIRRYLWSRTTVMDEALEYTGTGRELFLGFTIVALVLAVATAIYQVIEVIALTTFPALGVVLNVVLVAGIIPLIGIALYRARRYRISRTLWRGIRGAQTGSAGRYGLTYLAYWVLNVLTTGWTYPWMRIKLTRQIIGNSWFGDRRFGFEGDSAPLYGPFAVVWAVVFLALIFSASLIVATIVMAGVELAKLEQLPPPIIVVLLLPILFSILAFVFGMTWYKAREYAYIASSTRYEGLTFELNATFGGLLWLVVGNLLIKTLTLGLGTPFVQLRTIRYFSDRSRIDGEADFDAIRQSSETRPGLGEGLEAAFDVGDF